MRMLAHRHGIVDDPDNRRKIHSQPIAYLGGVSIFLGWLGRRDYLRGPAPA